MGWKGSLVYVRWKGPVEELTTLAEALETAPLDPWRRGLWWGVLVEEVPLEYAIQGGPSESLPPLAAETGAPVLSMSCYDSDVLTVGGLSREHGPWFTCIERSRLQGEGWRESFDTDPFLDPGFLDVPGSVEAAVAWATSAGLVPNQAALERIFSTEGRYTIDDVAQFELPDALGLPPEKA
jgi:hypothetical protein